MMETQQRYRSSETFEAGLLALLLAVLVGASFWLFVQRFWWFPPLVSEHGADSDRLFLVTLVVTGVMFIIFQLVLGYLVWRYRDRGVSVADARIPPRRERGFALVAAALIFAVDVSLAFMGEGAFLKASGEAPLGALTVEVTGEQFMWSVRYPGKDGRFGTPDPRKFSDTNPLGLDPNDADGRDDIVLQNEIHLPVDQPVRIQLKSKDVLHSFFLPHFRIKQDAVPGMTITVWFVPKQAGVYEIACAQLCGLAHYRMRGFVTVVSAREFERWLDAQAGQGG